MPLVTVRVACVPVSGGARTSGRSPGAPWPCRTPSCRSCRPGRSRGARPSACRSPGCGGRSGDRPAASARSRRSRGRRAEVAVGQRLHDLAGGAELERRLHLLLREAEVVEPAVAVELELADHGGRARVAGGVVLRVEPHVPAAEVHRVLERVGDRGQRRGQAPRRGRRDLVDLPLDAVGQRAVGDLGHERRGARGHGDRAQVQVAALAVFGSSVPFSVQVTGRTRSAGWLVST